MEHTILGGSGFLPVTDKWRRELGQQEIHMERHSRFYRYGNVSLGKTLNTVGLQMLCRSFKMEETYFPFLFSAHQDKKSEGFHTVSCMSATHLCASNTPVCGTRQITRRKTASKSTAKI